MNPAQIRFSQLLEAQPIIYNGNNIHHLNINLKNLAYRFIAQQLRAELTVPQLRYWLGGYTGKTTISLFLHENSIPSTKMILFS